MQWVHDHILYPAAGIPAIKYLQPHKEGVGWFLPVLIGKREGSTLKADHVLSYTNLFPCPMPARVGPSKALHVVGRHCHPTQMKHECSLSISTLKAQDFTVPSGMKAPEYSLSWKDETLQHNIILSSRLSPWHCGQGLHCERFSFCDPFSLCGLQCSFMMFFSSILLCTLKCSCMKQHDIK